MTAIIHPLVPSLESATQFVMLPSTSANQVTKKNEESNALAAEPSVINQNGSEVLVHNGQTLLEDNVLDMSANVNESIQAIPSTGTGIHVRQNQIQINTNSYTDSPQDKLLKKALSNQDVAETRGLMDTEATDSTTKEIFPSQDILETIELINTEVIESTTKAVLPDQHDTRELVNTQDIANTRQTDFYSSSKQSTSGEITKDHAEISAPDASKNGSFGVILQKCSNTDGDGREVILTKRQKVDTGEDGTKLTDTRSTKTDEV